jgi:hypothetical protein
VFKEIYNFRQASVVGVPIVAKVDGTLLSWLRWATSSYVGRLDTKTTSSRLACLKYLGLTIPWYVYGSANLVGHPGYVTSRGRCAIVALPARSGHQGFYVGNEGLPMGCAPDSPAKYFWVLGRFRFETFLRSACLRWLCQTLCSYARYLGVSTLHAFKINDFILDWFNHTEDFFIRSTLFKTLLGIRGYWALLFKTSSRSARLQRPP